MLTSAEVSANPEALAAPVDRGAEFAKRIAEPRAGVWVRGVIYGGSGYAQENLLTVMGLASRGIPVRIDPLQIQHDTQNLLSTETRTALEYLKLQPLDLARSVIFQEMPADSFRRDFYAKRRIGRTMFETDGLPHDWAEKCNAMDEIWVPSRFNVETFARAGVKEARLHLVQEGENTQMFRPGHEALPIAERRGFNFLSIFEWRKRKGPDVLFKAFCSEFRADEDVALILRAYATPQPDEDLLPRVTYFIERTCKKRLEDIPPIILLPGFLPQNDLPKLYATADCFVLPTRGEGWGRPLTESLASEVPVIATGWSGQMDFLTQANSYLVDFKLVPTGADIDLEFLAGHRWAEPSVEHLRELMRHVFEHRDEAKEKARQGRRDIVANHDMSVTMERWGREFDRVLA